MTWTLRDACRWVEEGLDFLRSVLGSFVALLTEPLASDVGICLLRFCSISEFLVGGWHKREGCWRWMRPASP